MRTEKKHSASAKKNNSDSPGACSQATSNGVLLQLVSATESKISDISGLR